MKPARPALSTWQTALVAGLVAGAVITYVDNFAFEGEVSPIVIIALLLSSSALAVGAAGVDCCGHHLGLRSLGSRREARSGLA
jgi:hypothetical protein